MCNSSIHDLLHVKNQQREMANVCILYYSIICIGLAQISIFMSLGLKNLPPQKKWFFAKFLNFFEGKYWNLNNSPNFQPRIKYDTILEIPLPAWQDKIIVFYALHEKYFQKLCYSKKMAENNGRLCYWITHRLEMLLQCYTHFWILIMSSFRT